jgi:hypothetical protein
MTRALSRINSPKTLHEWEIASSRFNLLFAEDFAALKGSTQLSCSPIPLLASMLSLISLALQAYSVFQLGFDCDLQSLQSFQFAFERRLLSRQSHGNQLFSFSPENTSNAPVFLCLR